jgi:hypothetical protein
MTKYNHAYTFGFEVPGSTDETGEDVTGAQLREALLERVNRLSDEEMVEACEAPYDTFEEESDDD